MRRRRWVRDNHSFLQAHLAFGIFTYRSIKRLFGRHFLYASDDKYMMATEGDRLYPKEPVELRTGPDVVL